MNIISTILIALSMSADAFAVALSKGAALRNPRPTEALRTGLIFGSIEAITPMIGWILGSLANTFVAAVDHWIAFVILAGLGARMLHESTQKSEVEDKPSRHNLHTLILAGIGSSIDALGVGVTLAFVNANIWVTATAIGFATFLMASIGIMMGHVVGNRAGKYAEAAGGIILIVIGTKILLEHTHVL